jgi:hypothetical protein
MRRNDDDDTTYYKCLISLPVLMSWKVSKYLYLSEIPTQRREERSTPQAAALCYTGKGRKG